MLKNSRGITLVTLVITIIVLIILGSVTTYTGSNTIKSARYYNSIAEIKAVKTKVDELYEEYQNGDEAVKTTILNQGEATTAKATELSNAYYVASQNNINGEDLGNEEDYRYYSKDYITNILDIDGIDRDFFINVRTRSVLLVKGVEYKEETYYALCQIEGEQYSIKHNQNLNIPEGWGLANKLNIDNDWYAYKNIGSESENVAKVNAPKLADGMVPIKYIGLDDQTNSTIEQLTSGSRWANAITKDGSMWVWIPRYAYKITSGYHQSGEDINPDDPTKGAGTIEIAFLDKNNNFLDSNITGTVVTSGVDDSTYEDSTKWILEPAFDFGDDHISGFWFAKFEASNTDGYGDESETANSTELTLQVKPSVRSWGSIKVKNMFTVCQELKSNTNYNNYFDNVTNVDTHMMKNVEWGAVSYLAHSKYGLNGEQMYINSLNKYITGLSSATVNGSTSISSTYNTKIGKNASTTKNVYGIYDMKGGSWDSVAACHTGNANKLTESTDPAFISKYIEEYSEYSILRYGDAFYETSRGKIGESSRSAWNGNHFRLYTPWETTTFNLFIRGGARDFGSAAGLFNINTKNDGTPQNCSFRPVIVVY